MCIAEDRVDYSRPNSESPGNSAVSYSYFLQYSGVYRFLFGLVLSLTVAASPNNYLQVDPFQLLIVCIFTVTSVASKMTAYLYKFTESSLISLVIPCLISIVLVVATDSSVGSINTVANYIATFFAYQFLVIIPFGLFYLRSSQMTADDVQEDEPAAATTSGSSGQERPSETTSLLVNTTVD